MKLSPRLNTLCQSIKPNEFHHIWDCCCDHGYLGQQLMVEHPTSQIHFVDVMPHLINEVKNRLNNHVQTNWVTHCTSAENIQLHTKHNHLVIIAGVGGDLLIEIVTRIINKHANLIKDIRLDFILCPIRQLHKVREGLNGLKLGLVNEKIIQDNKQFYEIIQVSNQSNRPISLVGDMMWDASNSQHRAYRNIMMAHYQKQPNDDAKNLFKLYQNIR